MKFLLFSIGLLGFLSLNAQSASKHSSDERYYVKGESKSPRKVVINPEDSVIRTYGSITIIRNGKSVKSEGEENNAVPAKTRNRVSTDDPSQKYRESGNDNSDKKIIKTPN